MEKNKFNRREFIKTAGMGALALSLPSVLDSCQTTQIKKNLSVLFIAVDDLRPQLSCYGHRQMISPNIDRLAAEGALFKRSFCQVPVCGASRASLMTGIRPNRNRFLYYYTRADEDTPKAVTLPDYFKAHGYRTISNGKIFHHIDDDLDGWSEDPWRYSDEHKYLIPENAEIHERNQDRTGKKGPNSRGPAFENANVPDEQYPDYQLTDKSIADLQRLKTMDKPFFLSVGFVRPHLPFNAPKKYWDFYKREEIDLADNPFRPKGAPDIAMHNWAELRAYHNIPVEGPVSDEMARDLIHGYYAASSFVDAQIGRLLDDLDRLDLRKNTIVILWGDHGWQLGEHGLWCKHCNFETSLHSPLIISAPGFKGDKVCNALTEFVDIYPSLCELTGLPLPDHLQGTSFVPLMKNPDRTWKKAAFSRWQTGDSIRTDRYRYTEWTDDEGKRVTRMLYDHKVDPMENVNISEQPENQELVERLSKMIKDGWQPIALEIRK
jgi:iduronate 2-sulfatase